MRGCAGDKGRPRDSYCCLLALSGDAQINERPRQISESNLVTGADVLRLRTGFWELRLERKAAEKLTFAGMIVLCFCPLGNLAHFGKMTFINEYCDDFISLNTSDIKI